MSRLGRAVLLLSLGLLVVRLAWTGEFGWFVQQRMALPLIAAAATLLGFAVVEVVGVVRAGDETADRPAGPYVGVLLVLPLLVLASVAPAGLGASAANRVDAYMPADDGTIYAALERSDGPLPMTVSEFQGRAIWDENQSLAGRTVRLEGIVVNAPEVVKGFKLTRFAVSCCAADGIPVQVTVRGVNQVFVDDTWVVADVMWIPPDVSYQDQQGEWVVEAEAVQIEENLDPPNDLYESPF